MQAGTLRDRITIYRPLEPSETTQDSLGRDEGSAEEVGSFWCCITPLAGRELDAVRQHWANARYKVVMRAQRGITFSGKMYFEMDGKRYNIVDVQDVGEAIRPDMQLIAESYEVPV
jgi:head-tail adaptor